ncbi:hypothetical protein OKW41_000281 [Paraburkholderia sp. UCT70]|uniref:hypothetical protein n=1 Tax=Paraburkholderia sp. UCT70 TaxID=2991068 RepID=UPI003D1D00A4
MLLFLMALGYRGASVERAAACLARHQDSASGGVRTYAKPYPILRYMRLGAHVRLAGWCRAHLEVTATAGRAFALHGNGYTAEAEAAWQYVRERQSDDGSWPSYWWNSRHYPTLQAVELAAVMQETRVVRRAAAWACSLQRRDGSWCRPKSAFATASSLSVLAVAGKHKHCRERAIHSLNAMREADGAWPSHAQMRVPPPWVTEPDDCRAWRVDGLGTGVVVHDQNRLFTTALCLGTLARTEGES